MNREIQTHNSFHKRRELMPPELKSVSEQAITWCKQYETQSTVSKSWVVDSQGSTPGTSAKQKMSHEIEEGKRAHEFQHQLKIYGYMHTMVFQEYI